MGEWICRKTYKHYWSNSLKIFFHPASTSDTRTYLNISYTLSGNVTGVWNSQFVYENTISMKILCRGLIKIPFRHVHTNIENLAAEIFVLRDLNFCWCFCDLRDKYFGNLWASYVDWMVEYFVKVFDPRF